ncbi:hypothetical protein CKO33_07955 [Ectothiorhodospira mobilis]|nr:hypothetical protein [Ectothiorhodospira mobilis]
MTIPERDLNILQVESEDISGVCFGDREMSGLAVMTTNLTDQVGLDGIVFVVSGATSIFLDVIPRTTDVGNFDMD